MVKRIENLTEAQKARVPEWCDKWIEIGLRTGETQWEEAEDALKVCYEKAGLKWHNNVVRVSSPIVGAFAAALANKILRSGDFGDAVGNAVRGDVHNAVGNAVGDDVHIAIGKAVRDDVHKAIGNAVSKAVGNAIRGVVHNAVGKAVRDDVHIAVGKAVRGDVHNAVGKAVSSAVGDAVGKAVGKAVGNVDNAVRKAVRDTVNDAIHGAVALDVRTDLNIDIDEAVRKFVGGAIDEFIDSAVGRYVDDDVGGAVEWHNWMGGQFWVGGWWGSPSFVSFFLDVYDLELSQDIVERAKAYQTLCESVNYIWANKAFAMICARPSHIHRDDQGRLHHETNKSIQYPDGWGLYCIHGVTVPDWIIECPEQISVDKIQKETNLEIQRVMIERYGVDKYLTETGANVIDADMRGIEGGGARALLREKNGKQWLICTDGSTERVYHLSVSRNATTCKQAHEELCGFNEQKIKMEG